jgi:hypothetical protein
MSCSLTQILNRAGFYAENLLLYSVLARQGRILPLPIGKSQQFAPVALDNVAQVAAHVLSWKSNNGFSDKHRGQLIVLTGPFHSLLLPAMLLLTQSPSGPNLMTGPVLAAYGRVVLGFKLEFKDISEYVSLSTLLAMSWPC